MRVRFAAVLAVLLCACGGAATPHVTVSVAGTNVPTGMGSYCWNSGGQGECADMASVEAVIQAKHLTPVLTTAGGVVTISFDRPPKSLDLRGGPDEAHMSAVPVSGFTFRVPVTPGETEYLLDARWSEGDVSWVFLISAEGL
jgi:hypothetical protein